MVTEEEKQPGSSRADLIALKIRVLEEKPEQKKMPTLARTIGNAIKKTVTRARKKEKGLASN